MQSSIRFLGSRPPSKYFVRWRSPSIIPRSTKDISPVKTCQAKILGADNRKSLTVPVIPLRIGPIGAHCAMINRRVFPFAPTHPTHPIFGIFCARPIDLSFRIYAFNSPFLFAPTRSVGSRTVNVAYEGGGCASNFCLGLFLLAFYAGKLHFQACKYNVTTVIVITLTFFWHAK